MTKLLNELKDAGMDVHQFTRSEEARYHLIENKGDEKKENIVELHSIIDLVDNIRTDRSPRPQHSAIQRSRRDELRSSSSKPRWIRTPPPPQGRHRRRRVADSIFSMLMGEDVPSRRAFIEDNALNVSH